MFSRSFRSVAVALFATGLAGGAASAASLSDLSFMSGCWQGTLAKGGTVEERYNAPAAGLMLGTSHTIENAKTRSFEFIRIEQKGEEVWMTPMPGGKASVSFKLVRLEGRKAVFENLEHDFPKRILYALKADGTLLARIEGESPEKAMDFPMQPIACAAPASPPPA